MTKMKVAKTPLSPQWWTYDDYSKSSSRTRWFVENVSEWSAKGMLVDRGIGTGCDSDCSWSCSTDHLPSISPLREGEKVPEKDEPRKVDLGGSQPVPPKKFQDHQNAVVLKADGTIYEAWKTIDYFNAAVYGGENGYGVRVWLNNSATAVFPVNSAGWDKTGNQSVPAHGKSIAFVPKQPSKIGRGWYYRDGAADYIAVWFPTAGEAEEFRSNCIEWQKALPKFDIQKHKPKAVKS